MESFVLRSTSSASVHLRSVALLFVGDQLPNTFPLDILEMQNPHVQLEILRKKFPKHSDHLVVFPSRLENGFSCYDQYLGCTSPFGDPRNGAYVVGGGLQVLKLMVSDHLSRVVPCMGPNHSDESSTPVDNGQTLTRVDLVGFSKGGVVLKLFHFFVESLFLVSLPHHKDFREFTVHISKISC